MTPAPGPTAEQVALSADLTNSIDVGGGVRLAYQTLGEPDSPPMVLLHGLTSDSSSWDPVVDAFARDWRVYAPDLRGHGRSDWPGTYSFELLRDDLFRFVTTLGLSDAVLVGHSMGGVAARLLAQLYPELPRALVLAEAPPPFPQQRPMPERPDGELAYDWPVRPAIVAQVNAPDPAWWEGLAGIEVPTLVIGGGPDSPFPQEQMRAVAERIPDGRWLSIPVGHGVHKAAPAEFTAAVLEFTAGI